MIEIKTGRLASAILSGLILTACGGGGSSTSSDTASSSSSTASSTPGSAKTAPEAFYEMYGVKPGIYEITFKGATATLITQGRILANETALGSTWGFIPYIEICNDADEGSNPYYFGTGMKQGDLPKGQIYYVPVNSNFGENIILTADTANTNILTGSRFNEGNGETETIEMHWISGDKNYSEGSVDLTTSIPGLESITSSSVCYSTRSTTVDYGDGLVVTEKSVYINVLKERTTGENAGKAGARIAGIRIEEESDATPEKKDSSFFYMFLQEGAFAKELIPHGMVNRELNELGALEEQTTHAISSDALNFSVNIKGVADSDAAGFFVKGDVSLKAK